MDWNTLLSIAEVLLSDLIKFANLCRDRESRIIRARALLIEAGDIDGALSQLLITSDVPDVWEGPREIENLILR